MSITVDIVLSVCECSSEQTSVRVCRYSKSAEENNASKLPVLGRTTQPLAAPQASAWAQRFDISKRMQDDVLLRCESMITAASCAGATGFAAL